MNKSPRDNSIGAQMAIVLQLMKRKNHQAITAAGYEITMEQFGILETLMFHGNMNMTGLSNVVWKQNANITRIIDKLEKQKLVVRKAIKGDRRAHLICITKKGEQLYEDVIPVIFEVYEKSTSCITDKEEADLLRTIKKLITHITKN